MIFNLKQSIINTYYNDYKFFLSKPNVEGIGYGYRYINKICTGEPSILIFVTKKISLNCLPNNGLIPALYKGIKTDVIETGTFYAGRRCTKNAKKTDMCSSIPCNMGSYIKRVRPVQAGYCVGILNRVPHKSGTLGYIVTDNEQLSKTYCFLSTNLIFADGNKAPIGTNIIQPSNEYGGDDPKNIIAKLLRFVPLKFINKVPDLLEDFNTVDCAAASFVNVGEVELINPFIPEIGVPKGISMPEVRQSMQWTGCISGHQDGIVVAESAMIKVTYEICGEAYFKDIIVSNGPVAVISDLGALACDSDKNALGLIFASSGPMNFSYNLISNISNIQNELKVTLLTVKS